MVYTINSQHILEGTARDTVIEKRFLTKKMLSNHHGSTITKHNDIFASLLMFDIKPLNKTVFVLF
jgi:hypothetical protein